METFRSFKDALAAEDLARWLSDRGIGAVVADTSAYFDPSFAYSILSREWAVRIAAEDFTKAGEILYHFYEQRLDSIPRDYYLFAFSDRELEEILEKPDEWGDLDYALAQHILRQRGKGVTEQGLRELRNKRYEALSMPEADSAGAFIGWGYILSVAGGLIGSMIGWYLVNSQKILPDGKKVPRFTGAARAHGKRIFRIGVVVCIVLGLLRLYFRYRSDIGSSYP